MAHVSSLLDRNDDLLYGEPELPSAMIETAVKTMDEYSQALNNFLED